MNTKISRSMILKRSRRNKKMRAVFLDRMTAALYFLAAAFLFIATITIVSFLIALIIEHTFPWILVILGFFALFLVYNDYKSGWQSYKRAIAPFFD